MDLNGSITALVTPFASDGSVDFKCLGEFVSWQLRSGIRGLVVCGTTGEAPTLSFEEKLDILRCVVDVVKNRCPVIMGATFNDTKEVIRLIHAFNLADAVLVAAPYYNKPSQEGIYQHYKMISEEVSKPLIVYDIPGRTSVAISNDTISKIVSLPNVVGIKDSTGDLTRPIHLRNIGIALLSGDDITALPYNVHGGVGCISVTANIVPDRCSFMQSLCTAGDFVSACKINYELFALNLAMFFDTNPVAVKYALSILKKEFSPVVRMPLVEPSESVKKRIADAIHDYFSNDKKEWGTDSCIKV